MTSAAANPPCCASPSLLSRPEGLDGVLGRVATVDALRRIVREDDVSAHVILHGPYGVSKRMLAQLCAKAMMCADSKVSSSSCNVCDTCLSFRTGGPLGYTHFNAACGREERETKIAAVVANANSPTLADRSVVVIENVDALEARSFDKMLKTLEERATTFILTTQSLDKVRPAIRSRSVERAVRPLTVGETRVQLEVLLDARGIDVEEPAIDSLTAFSLGRPSRIVGIVRRVAIGAILSVHEVRQRFGSIGPSG